MRCPCCDSEVDRDALVTGRELWLPDGRVLRDHHSTMEVLERLLRHGSVPSDKKKSDLHSNVVSVCVHRLRAVLRDNRVPLRIDTDRENHRYVLIRE